MKMIEVEYYRCWSGGDGGSGTWDTDYIAIPADTPENEMDHAVIKACSEVTDWRNNDPPVFVGLYCVPDPDDE